MDKGSQSKNRKFYPEINTTTTHEKGYGRIEKRSYYLTNELDWLAVKQEYMTAMKEIFVEVLQQGMECELEEKLGYEKSERMSNTDEKSMSKNYRNGYSKKTVKTQLGEVDIRVPRDRNGEYADPVVPIPIPISTKFTFNILAFSFHSSAVDFSVNSIDTYLQFGYNIFCWFV